MSTPCLTLGDNNQAWTVRGAMWPQTMWIGPWDHGIVWSHWPGKGQWKRNPSSQLYHPFSFPISPPLNNELDYLRLQLTNPCLWWQGLTPRCTNQQQFTVCNLILNFGTGSHQSIKFSNSTSSTTASQLMTITANLHLKMVLQDIFSSSCCFSTFSFQQGSLVLSN